MSRPTNDWGIKTNQSSFVCGNRNGHHNMEKTANINKTDPTNVWSDY